jgi:spermidine dehydrogenase
VQLKKHWVQRRPESPVDPGIILNRWGRAYLTPLPGFFFGQDGKPAPPGSPAGSPFGRIAFAKTDLSGVADHRSSIIEANRVVGQLLVLS